VCRVRDHVRIGLDQKSAAPIHSCANLQGARVVVFVFYLDRTERRS